MPSLRASALALPLLLSSCAHPPPPEPPLIPAAKIEEEHPPGVRFIVGSAQPPTMPPPAAPPGTDTAGTSGGTTRMSAGDCDRIIDRYIELLLGSDAAGVPDGARKDAMRTAKAAIAGDPNLVKAKQECLKELTQEKYGCAMGASTVDAWQSCLK